MKQHKFLIFFLILLLSVGVIGAASLLRWNAKTVVTEFTESSKEVVNPNRGFYHIYGERITDEESNAPAQLIETLAADTDTSLSLMEINLYAYRNSAISDAGLQNIRELFAAMEQTDHHWIVRFLYNWGDLETDYEPDSLDTILLHMEQLSPVLKRYADCIFTLQGFFTGIYGEMNNTAFSDETSLQTLAEKLLSVTDESTYLSVRTPQQWRICTQTADPAQTASALQKRLGLYNDGMLGSESDYGTYGDQTAADGAFVRWTRAEELEFQNTLCLRVPNGGEVVVDNACNDLENAVADLQAMHVTYLNRDHDSAVLEKWAAATIHTDDCFDGMDGLSYIERHLGYRLTIADAALSYHLFGDTLDISVTLKNVGFAPVYKPCTGTLTVTDDSGDVVWQSQTSLPDDLTFSGTVAFRFAESESFSIYFSLTDDASGQSLTLANEQEAGAHGYLIGQITES